MSARSSHDAEIVSDRVQNMTGLRVTEMNATISEIIFPEGGGRRRSLGDGARTEPRTLPTSELRPGAAEREMRAAVEPVKTDLDVAGLKEQVLRRIEVLEEQERERQELLTDVLAMAEDTGLDAGALKAVMNS